MCAILRQVTYKAALHMTFFFFSYTGFSRTTVDLLNKHEADYSSFDILTDEEVRQGLKSYSNWPTYPQVCCLLLLLCKFKYVILWFRYLLIYASLIHVILLIRDRKKYN